MLLNHRFWLQTVTYPVQRGISRDNLVQAVCGALNTVKNGNPQQVDGKITVPYSEFGIIIIPEYQIVMPIHEGMTQSQHALRIKGDWQEKGNSFTSNLDPSSSKTTETDNDIVSVQVTVCGFANRAQHIITSPSETARPVNPERLAAITLALPLHCGEDVTMTSLLSGEEFEGTPPSRILRSFICPRSDRNHLPEEPERAAKRTAEQIALAVRRLRADRASYLRNVDRPLPGALDDSVDENSKNSNTANESETESRDAPSSGDQRAHSMQTKHPVVLVLDNVRSAFNVGSMFRTADTAGLSQLITCGITPHPPYSDKLRKTAFSALDTVPTKHFDDVVAAIQHLRAEGYTICVLETTKMSQLYTDVAYPEKVALVVGNEVSGVDARVIESADCVAEIPTFGSKNSLNVAAAAPIVVYEVLRQFRQHQRSNAPETSSAPAQV